MNLERLAASALMYGGQPDFGGFVRGRGGAGRLVVQPRMGFDDPGAMRSGLAAVRSARARTVGTITLDSYTRVGGLRDAEQALREGIPLNGYPIVTHSRETTGRMLAGLAGPAFPVQVRHGSAVPKDIFHAMMLLRLNATEGGPVSYCLPYGRTPLSEAVDNWTACCETFALLREVGVEPHLETFGGCMLGQLCPPSQLVALSVLEALFFAQHGIRSISVSYAQQTSTEQDIEALCALRALCAELLPTSNWHVVLYGYMGVYPTTADGALRLAGRGAELAVATGTERMIVKTVAESTRIPTVEENVQALEYAGHVAKLAEYAPDALPGTDSLTFVEARSLIEAVLELDEDIGKALLIAFKCGYLDVPYCLHPDNMGNTRSYIDDSGRLRWGATGALPLPVSARRERADAVGSTALIRDLNYVRGQFDCASWPPHALPEAVRPVLDG